MKRKDYIKPICSLVYMLDDLMEETLPLAGSPNFTDSGDNSGGGLSKKDFTDTDDGDANGSNKWSDN